MSSTQNPKRHHHFLPRLYLKGFIEPGSRWFVWEYVRGERFDPGLVENRHNPWRAPLKRAGARQDFYAQPKPDGTVDFDTYENILEKLEKGADPVFHKLRVQDRISASEKVLLASYIGVMLKRVPAREKRTASIWPELLKRTNWEDLVKWGEARGITDSRHQVEAIKREFQGGMPREIALKSMVISYDRVLDALSTMSWKFFVAPSTTAFATSDNPVYFPEAVGIADEKAVLVFPISSEVALVASWYGRRDLSYVKATKSRVMQINSHILGNAVELGYFQSADENIQRLLDAAVA
jgi:hypothetical protein